MSTTTIVGNLLRPDATYPTGSVILISNDARFVDTGTDTIGGQAPYIAPLDAVGSFSATVLTATDGYFIIPNIDGVTFSTPATYTAVPNTNPYYLGGGAATAPTTFYASGTWANLDGTPATGTIEATPFDSHFTNNGHLIFNETISRPLDANGRAAIKLVRATHGYKIVEKITGSPPFTRFIPGTGNISLSGGAVVTVPGVPFSVAVAIVDFELVTIWTPPNSDGGLPIIDYTVTVTAVSPLYNQSQVVSADNLFVATFDQIFANTEYAIAVTARNDVGSSGVNSVGLEWDGSDTSGTGGSDGSGESGAVLAPDPPTNLNITAANEALFVNWRAPAMGGAPDFYVVTCTGQATQTVDAAGALWQKCLFLGLTNGSSYTVTVAAVNFGGTSSSITSTVSPSIQRPDTVTAAGDMISGCAPFSNTGLTPNATKTFTTNATLVSQIFTGPLFVNAGVTVTLIGCKIQADPSFAQLMGSGDGAGTFILKYCELDGSTGTTAFGVDGKVAGAVVWGIRGSNFTLVGCYLHNMCFGTWVEGDSVTSKWSLMKTFFTFGGIPSGFKILKGTNLLFTGNMVRLPSSLYDGACFYINNLSGTISNLTINNNYIDGGLWGIATRRSGTNVLSNVTIQNNRWLRSARVRPAVTLGGSTHTIVADFIASTTPTAGTIQIATDRNGWQTVNYSGLTGGTTFTGCSGGSGKVTPASPIPPNWSNTTTYALGAIVNFPINGVFRAWASLKSPNVGRTPGTVGSTFWAETLAANTRVGGNLYDPKIGGVWSAGGYNDTVDIAYVPTGSYTHTGNVWDDAGTAVPGL